MSELTTFISNVGFPIVMCLLLFYQYKAQTQMLDKLESTVSKLIDRIDELADTVKDHEDYLHYNEKED